MVEVYVGQTTHAPRMGAANVTSAIRFNDGLSGQRTLSQVSDLPVVVAG